MSKPVIITARLTSAIVGMEDRIMLDGPLAWTWVALEKQAGRHLPKITDDFAVDIPLPFERWELNNTWGWKVSQADEHVLKWGSVEIRRKPATREMSLLTDAKKHHAGLGPMKARNTVLSSRVVSTLTWHAIVTDTTELGRLLDATVNVSARWRNGFGHVSSWTVEPDTETDAWRHRPLPAEGGIPTPIRPPYWHHTRFVPCMIP